MFATYPPFGRRRRCSGSAVALAALIVMTAGCQPGFDNPPDHPRHSEDEEGAAHADGKKYPFLCRGNNGVRGYIACPTKRLPDDQLSCDAFGCHGSYDYAPGRALAFRVLGGSEGPSCHTCHGQEWREIGRDPSVPIDWTKVREDD